MASKLIKFGVRGYEFATPSSEEVVSIGVLDTRELRTQDSYLILNSGYTTNTPKFGGIVIVDAPTSTQTNITTNGFVAGVEGVSNPYVNVSSSEGFSTGDVVLIADSLGNNDAIYEVSSVSSGIITLRGLGTDNVTQNFFRNQVTAITGASGTVTKIRISILRSKSSGGWESATGSSSNSFIFSALGISDTLRKTIDTTNSPYAITNSDECIFIDATAGNVIINLPSINGSGISARILRFKRLDGSGNQVQLSAGAGTIDGSVTYVFPGRYSALSVVDNGSEWSIF